MNRDIDIRFVVISQLLITVADILWSDLDNSSCRFREDPVVGTHTVIGWTNLSM